MPEALPRSCAVDGRRFLQFGIDGLQPGEQTDGVERHAAPYIDDNHRNQREIRVAEPIDARMDDAKPEQRPVDDAESRIEHPLPGEGRKHCRDDKGEQDKRAGESLAPKVAIEKQSKPQAEAKLEHRGDRRIDEGIPNGGAEDGVMPQRLEVLETNKVARHAYPGIGNRKEHALDEWVGNKEAEQNDSRQQQNGGKPAFILKKPCRCPALQRTRKWPPADDIAYRHRLAPWGSASAESGLPDWVSRKATRPTFHKSYTHPRR